MYVHLTNINTVLDQLDCMYYCLNRASQQVDGQIEAAQAAMSVLSVFRRGGLVQVPESGNSFLGCAMLPIIFY